MINSCDFGNLRVPMYAQAQQLSAVDLKAEARNFVKIVSADKLKSQTYCEIVELNDQIDQEEDPIEAQELLRREINWGRN